MMQTIAVDDLYHQETVNAEATIVVQDPYSTQSSMDSNDKRGVFTAEDHDGSEESCFLHVEATTAPVLSSLS